MRVDIPPGDFAGYIFDLDGTLLDTMPIHFQAWDRTLRRFGLTQGLDEDLFYSLGGMPTDRVAEVVGQHYGIALDAVEVSRQKEEHYKGIVPQARITVIEPVADFARRVAAHHPVAIVTGGTPDVAGASLAATGLAGIFSLIITPLDVPAGRGKPAPDMFLLAAERMGVPPSRCLVFEDAAPGIAGARAAGMPVVIVSSRPSS